MVTFVSQNVIQGSNDPMEVATVATALAAVGGERCDEPCGAVVISSEGEMMLVFRTVTLLLACRAGRSSYWW